LLNFDSAIRSNTFSQAAMTAKARWQKELTCDAKKNDGVFTAANFPE
jgi:hypothetical protein